MARLLPTKLVCCNKERKQIAMEKARASLEKEADILKFFRTQRFLLMATKHLLDPALRKELKAKSKYKEIAFEETRQLDEFGTGKKVEVQGIANDFSVMPKTENQVIGEEIKQSQMHTLQKESHKILLKTNKDDEDGQP